MKKHFSRRFEIFLEFLLVGVAIGVIEDTLAIMLVADRLITWREFWFTCLIALPFAMFSELIVDRHHLVPVHKENSSQHRPEKK